MSTSSLPHQPRRESADLAVDSGTSSGAAAPLSGVAKGERHAAAEELHQLNLQVGFPTETLRSGRSGLFGAPLRWLRRKLVGDLLTRQELYLGHLARYLNAVAANLQRLEAERIERLGGTFETVEQELHTRLDELRRTVDVSTGGHQRTLALLADRLKQVESVAKGLERLIAMLSPAEANAATANPPAHALPNISYLLFENRFRGDEETIAGRLAWYGELFSGAPGPVLELGPGRGELLELLRNRGIGSYGVEIDAGMVERCRERGLDVRNEDILSHLAKLPPRSLGGFAAVQVIEHLSPEFLGELMRTLRAAMIPGAFVALETIDTLSLVAAAHNYTRDVTHVAPRHPDTVQFLVEMAGFETVERRLLSPFPAGAMLQPVPSSAGASPAMSDAFAVLNRNIEQLNGLLYGHQDYALIAKAV